MVTDLAGDEGHLRPAGRLEEGAVDHAPDLDGVRGNGDYVREHADHVRRHQVPLHWKIGREDARLRLREMLQKCN